MLHQPMLFVPLEFPKMDSRKLSASLWAVQVAERTGVAARGSETAAPTCNNEDDYNWHTEKKKKDVTFGMHTCEQLLRLDT